MPFDLGEQERSVRALGAFARSQHGNARPTLRISNETGLPLAVAIRFNEAGNTLTIHVTNEDR